MSKRSMPPFGWENANFAVRKIAIMAQQITHNANYAEAIKAIKAAILQSRYTAARLVNREMLTLYYGVGEYISQHSRTDVWGTGALDVISQQLQQELPGLRGFSVTNLKNMRLFYENWCEVFSNRPLTTDDLSGFQVIDNKLVINRQLTTDDFIPLNRQSLIGKMQNQQLPTADFPIDAFLSVSFTHHIQIFSKCKSTAERLFYIRRCAAEFWSVEKLKYHLAEKLYAKQSPTTNFERTIQNLDFRKCAVQSFKDEYLLDFINIEDPDEADERVIESQIVANIKKFIMALGNDFSFMGNQYRLTVDDKEYFIDLLFFNRRLQSLVAIELKRGEFKPEYAGKLNFYLSALDELVRLPHENPSIGIVLCKSQRQRTVEFAFRDTSKPMGVATYKTARELPQAYQGILPDAEDLKRLLDE